jgi:hypothetical protein
MRGIFHRHIFSPSLVVVDQFNVNGILSVKAENDAPVCSHGDGPKAASSGESVGNWLAQRWG